MKTFIALISLLLVGTASAQPADPFYLELLGQWEECTDDLDVLEHEYTKCFAEVNVYVYQRGGPPVQGYEDLLNFQYPHYPPSAARNNTHYARLLRDSCHRLKLNALSHLAACFRFRNQIEVPREP
jgi:hypothetical protein